MSLVEPVDSDKLITSCFSPRRLPLTLMTIAYYQIVRVLWRSDTIPGHTNVKVQKQSYYRSEHDKIQFCFVSSVSLDTRADILINF